MFMFQKFRSDSKWPIACHFNDQKIGLRTEHLSITSYISEIAVAINLKLAMQIAKSQDMMPVILKL